MRRLRTTSVLALLLSWGSAAAQAAAPEPDSAPLHFTIELLDPLLPLIGIRVEVAGDQDGVSEFSLAPGWAGLAETGGDLELVEVRDADGALEHERLAPHRWSVTHAPGAALAATFELQPTKHRANPGPPEYYLPILEERLFHGIGAQTLPAPEHCPSGEERSITLSWAGFEESGWRTISSFAAEPEETVRASLDEFLHALFLAGDLGLERREIHGQSVWVSVFGQWSFQARQFVDLAASIVALEREFFEDHSKDFYLISLIPVGAGVGSSSWGGTGLTNSFALFMTPDNGLETSENGAGVTWLLAHELFHEWNGHVITLALPEELGYWFSEGFTDFYTRRLLVRAGLLTPEKELRSWNQRFAEHAANPERHASATRIQEAFWTVKEVGFLPYQRGDLIALYADHAIRSRSGGQHSLDELMRILVDRARAGAGPFATADLLDAIGELAGDDAAAALRTWAVDGQEPELPATIGAPDFVLEHCGFPAFDTGFDHEAARKSGLITGVRPDGLAARAGLADGMAFAGWSVNLGQVSQPIEVTVREAGELRKIRYLPHGAPVSGVRFVRP